MRAGARRFVLGASCAGLAAAWLSGCGGERASDRARLSLVETLGGADTSGWARAVEPRTFRFPEDHGPHPAFRTEWWYVTGNLETPGGQPVGFQLTFFRSALAPPRADTVGERAPGPVAAVGSGVPRTASAWATEQAWMAHFALTDGGRGAFHAFERFDRAALGLAGAEAHPLRVWLGDWSLAAVDPADSAPVPTLRLRAQEGEVGLDLTLEPGKPPVLQGDEGLSRKGPEPGNASYYYSLTRMPASGWMRSGVDTVQVSGLAWLDREWSTSVLSEGVVGWDWFALQLDDRWDLMIYRLRTAAGGAHELSEGVLVDPEGGARRLSWGTDVQVEATGTWRAADGTVYPSGWRVRVPARGWDLDVRPLLDAQELDLAFRYWEGSVRVTPRGASAGAPGRGYVELTGYAGELPER